MKQYDALDYDEIDEQLDKELFETIFKGAQLPEGVTYSQAIGKAIAVVLPKEELEDFIEVPSRKTLDEWIHKGEELRKMREEKKK